VGGWLTTAGPRRGSTALVIGVLAAIAAAGCSSAAGSGAATAQGTAQGSPAQAVALAATAAGTVNSFTATVGLDLTMINSTTGNQRVTVSGTVSEAVRPSTLAEFSFDTLQVAGVSLPGGMSEIVTPNEIYLKQSDLSMLLHTSKQWFGLSVSSVSGRGGLNLNSLLGESDTSNPLTQAQLLAGATGVKDVGTGTVKGVPVTEYTGSYSLSAALAKLPANVRGTVSSAFKQSGLDSGTAKFTVWIDAQHIVRKDITALSSSTFNETLTTTVTSVNQPVNITAPSAGQVYPLSVSDLGSLWSA